VEELRLARKKDSTASNQLIRCSWWPVCTKYRHECGGVQKNLCDVYGDNGTQEAPPMEELKRRRNIFNAKRKGEERKAKREAENAKKSKESEATDHDNIIL